MSGFTSVSLNRRSLRYRPPDFSPPPPPLYSFSLPRFVIERTCACVRMCARHPATSGRRNRGSVRKEETLWLSSSVRVRIEREGDIVGFDHGWRKGIFSPLLITDVLILREEVEREIDTPLWESIYPSVYLSPGKEEGIEFELTFDGRPWKESAITTIIATISFPRKLPPRSLPWERNVSRCAVISSSYAQPTFPSS